MNTKVVKNLRNDNSSWENGLELLDACIDDIAYARYLLHIGNSNVNWKETESGNSILHILAYTDSIVQMKLLIDHGADINIRNKNDETPLHWCAKLNSKKCAKLLLECNCDGTAKDLSQSTPLHCAAAAGHVEIVPLLLDSVDAIEMVQLRDMDGCCAIELTYNGKSPPYFAITILLTRFYNKHQLTLPKPFKSNNISQFQDEENDGKDHPQELEKKPQSPHSPYHQHNSVDPSQQNDHRYMQLRDSDILHKLQELQEPRELQVHDARDHSGHIFNVKHVHDVPVSSAHGGIGEDVTGISSMNLTPPHSPRPDNSNRSPVLTPRRSRSSSRQHSPRPEKHSHSVSPKETETPQDSKQLLIPPPIIINNVDQHQSPSRSPRSRPTSPAPFRPSSSHAEVSHIAPQRSPRYSLSPRSKAATKEAVLVKKKSPITQQKTGAIDYSRAQRRKSITHHESSRPTILSLMAKSSEDNGDPASSFKDDNTINHGIESSKILYSNRSSIAEVFRDSSTKFEKYIGSSRNDGTLFNRGLQAMYDSKHYIRRSLAQSMFTIAQNLPFLPAIQPDREKGVTKVHTEYLDVIIAIEHCTDCEKHNGISLRHNPAKYVKMANDVLFTTIKAIVDAKLAVRLYALRVRHSGRDRLGAMEVTVAANITCPLMKKFEAVVASSAPPPGKHGAGGIRAKGMVSNSLQRTSTQTAHNALLRSDKIKKDIPSPSNKQHKSNKNNNRRTIAQSFDSSLSSNKNITKAAAVAAAAATDHPVIEEGEDDEDEDDDSDSKAKLKPPPGWATHQLYSKLNTKTWPNPKMVANSTVSFLRAVLKEASLNYHSIADQLHQRGIENVEENSEDGSSSENSSHSSTQSEDSHEEETSDNNNSKKKVGDFMHDIMSQHELEDVQKGYESWVQRMKIPPRMERHALDLDWPEELVSSPNLKATNNIAPIVEDTPSVVKEHPPGPMLATELADKLSRTDYEKLALNHFLVFDSKIRPPGFHKHHHHHHNNNSSNNNNSQSKTN